MAKLCQDDFPERCRQIDVFQVNRPREHRRDLFRTITGNTAGDLRHIEDQFRMCLRKADEPLYRRLHARNSLHGRNGIALPLQALTIAPFRPETLHSKPSRSTTVEAENIAAENENLARFQCGDPSRRDACRSLIVPAPLTELPVHLLQPTIQMTESNLPHWPGKRSIERLCDASGDAGQGIAVSADGNSLADGILEILALQKTDDRLRNRPLAAGIPTIGPMQFLPRTPQVIAKPPADVLADLLLVGPGPCQENRGRRRLCPLDPLGMIVGDFRRNRSDLLRPLQTIEIPADSRHPHRGPIAPGTISTPPAHGPIDLITLQLLGPEQPS